MYIFKELATNFAVTDVDSGISYTLSSFLGKVVVLDLFATWCSPCAVALPYLRQLHLKYKSELFQIISILLSISISTGFGNGLDSQLRSRWRNR